MTLPKRLRLGSRYKRRPRRGGREGGKEHRPRGYSSSCHQSPASAGLEGADPSCQALCMHGNKETELRKDIPGASRRQSTGESIFLACQRVGEGFFLKACFQHLHYLKQKKSLTFSISILTTPLEQQRQYLPKPAGDFLLP